MTVVPTPRQPILRLCGISKRFGTTQALSSVSLDIAAGRIHALVGENGAGKSTLTKIVSGVVQPDSGTMMLDGEAISFASPSAASSAGIGLVHQEFALLPFSTVTENIFLGRELRGTFGLDWPSMNRASRDALEALGVDVDVTRYVGELSTAHQQMVEIARATRSQCRLMILDEPTAALPPDDARKLHAVLRQLAAKGVSIIYISHRLDEVKELANDISVLKDGRHVATRLAADLTVDDMIGLMVGRVISDLFPSRPVDRPHILLLSVSDLAAPPAVMSANIDLAEGEIIGLYGLDGHGQDEVLACIAGALRPLGGRLSIRRKPVAWQSVAGMVRHGVGFVPEDRKAEGLILPMTGLQNISLPMLRSLARNGVVSRSKEESLARKAAQQGGVRGNLSAAVRTLSGGNQQKILLSRWLAAETTVLLLNQPTRGVDVGSKSEIYTLIRKICAEQGAGVIVVSREILELQGLCDRILVMSHGRLVAEHRPDDSEASILRSAVGSQRDQVA